MRSGLKLFTVASLVLVLGCPGRPAEAPSAVRRVPLWSASKVIGEVQAEFEEETEDGATRLHARHGQVLFTIDTPNAPPRIVPQPVTRPDLCFDPALITTSTPLSNLPVPQGGRVTVHGLGFLVDETAVCLGAGDWTLPFGYVTAHLDTLDGLRVFVQTRLGGGSKIRLWSQPPRSRAEILRHVIFPDPVPIGE